LSINGLQNGKEDVVNRRRAEEKGIREKDEIRNRP
jgi:hypothetical protein